MNQESIETVRSERDRLAKTLAERSAQLDAVSREFEQFTQALSHDLRAPLRAVEGFAQILLEDYCDKLDPDGKRCLETLSAGAQKASALIEALHGLARLCKKPFQPAVIDMRALAGRIIEELKTVGSTAKFRIGALPPAWGDPELIENVLEELLRNAVKFTGRQNRPSIEINGHDEKGHTVYSVRDNGVGFDPKYTDRLFTVFQRLHDEKDFEGKGMGLAAVQRLVHRHGGEVFAEGKLDAGATFSFSLPVRPN